MVSSTGAAIVGQLVVPRVWYTKRLISAALYVPIWRERRESLPNISMSAGNALARFHTRILMVRLKSLPVFRLKSLITTGSI